MKTPPSKRVHPRDSEPVEPSSEAWDLGVDLVPIRIRAAGDGDIFNYEWRGQKFNVEYGRRVSMQTAGKTDQNRFLEAMLKFKWLSPELRRAVMSELGRSVQKEKKEINYAIAITLRHLLEECKAKMRKQGKKAHGGIHDAALEHVAASQGITVEALKKRLERYPDPERRTTARKRRSG